MCQTVVVGVTNVDLDLIISGARVLLILALSYNYLSTAMTR